MISNFKCPICYFPLKAVNKIRKCSNCNREFEYDEKCQLFKGSDFMYSTMAMNVKNNLKSDRAGDGEFPKGIVNKNNLCWLISFVQVLFHIPLFREV
jgi:hypothetical protein